ncbi:MAG: hypothetical protein H6976_08470 [Gammaproteobacteria bacterium]|nr:hypothetical protein [Gammaproteobacteria bacterium]
MHLVTRTINDLYYVLSVREFLSTLFAGQGRRPWGCWRPGGGLAAGAGSRRRSTGRGAKSRLSESRWRASLPRFLLAGLALLAAGGLVLLFFPAALVTGFAGLFLLILGCALLTRAFGGRSGAIEPTIDRSIGTVGAHGQPRCRLVISAAPALRWRR